MASNSHTSNGFTLIEVVIVVLVLGIITAVSVPRLIDKQDEAREAATRRIVTSVRERINVYHAEHHVFPADIDRDWFPRGRIRSPYGPHAKNAVRISTDANKRYPSKKSLTTDSERAFWYNSANGEFYARVRTVESRVLVLFNRVNESVAVDGKGGASKADDEDGL